MVVAMTHSQCSQLWIFKVMRIRTSGGEIIGILKLKDDMPAALAKEAKEGLRSAAGAARITDEVAGIDDQKHTSEGVCCSDRQQLGSSCKREERSSCINPRKRG